MTRDEVVFIEDCTSCHEGMPNNECPKSRRSCGHHCNHSWGQDRCCWCGKEFGDEFEVSNDQG